MNRFILLVFLILFCKYASCCAGIRRFCNIESLYQLLQVLGLINLWCLHVLNSYIWLTSGILFVGV